MKVKFMNKIFDEIRTERTKQDKKWGGSNHDDTHISEDWCDYIQHQIIKWEEDEQTEREMFLKVAALSVAAIESLCSEARVRKL